VRKTGLRPIDEIDSQLADSSEHFTQTAPMKALVSILIPAYNAERWIGEAIQSAVNQTWPQKEIIVLNDGSTDRTANIARQFGSIVSLISTENRGLSAAVNHAYRLSKGDYIQELDADDILPPDKIERQLAALRGVDGKRVLLSSTWAPFYYRPGRARAIQNSLCQDLSPVEWLLRKMSENLHMQNANWLVNRELAEAAGLWDEQLCYDQDGEYFARVVKASQKVRFVPGIGVYYRASGRGSISVIGNSERKRKSLFRSMKLHMQYLQSMEGSERVNNACLTYMQNWYEFFYLDYPSLAAELQNEAASLHGHLEKPLLRRKYAWMEPVIGFKAARQMQIELPQFKASCIRQIDKAIYWLGEFRTNRRAKTGPS
jgi:glycosyltransferase involved in cell wall biosynthesis